MSKLADNLWLSQSTKDVGKGGPGPLGRFPTAEEAALRYTEHAKELEAKAIAKASRTGGERVVKKARATPSTQLKEEMASRKQQGAGDEYVSAGDDVESDDEERMSTARASRRRWPIPSGNTRATRGAAMEEAAATALVEASRERVRNPGLGYRSFPIAGGSIDPGKAAIEALLALSTPADLARMGVKPNEFGPAATVSTPKPAVVAPFPASLRKTAVTLEPALDGAYSGTSRRSVGLGRMPPSTDEDFSFPLNLLGAACGDERGSSMAALSALSRSTTLDTEVMDMDDEPPPLPTNGHDKRGYPKFTRRSDAATVDPKLWPGAAEEGWTLSAHGGGHYVYIAPDGTRCSSKKSATEWAEANPTANPNTTTATTIAMANATTALHGDMAAVAAAAATAARAAAAVAAAATSTAPLMRLPLRTNLVIDSRLGSGPSTPCSAGGPPTCFPSQCATRCASPVAMSSLYLPPSSVHPIHPMPTIGQPAAGVAAPPLQPVPFSFPTAGGTASIAANTAVSTWKPPIAWPSPLAAGLSPTPSHLPLNSCDGVVPPKCAAGSEPSSPALVPRAAKPLPALKQKARRSDEGNGPPRKAKAAVEATSAEPKAGGKLKRVDPALRDIPATSNPAFLGRDALIAENVGASRALAVQREARKAASATLAAMETEIISDEGSPIFIKVSSAPIKD